MARSPDDPLMGACVAFLQPHAALVPRGNARPRPPPEDDQRALEEADPLLRGLAAQQTWTPLLRLPHAAHRGVPAHEPGQQDRPVLACAEYGW